MTTVVSIAIQQITITPGTGAVDILYQISLDNKHFSGPVGGGQTSVPDEKICQSAVELSEQIEERVLLDLGLKKDLGEEPLTLELEEDPL